MNAWKAIREQSYVTSIVPAGGNQCIEKKNKERIAGGPVTVRPMTEEEKKRYGGVAMRKCEVCGKEKKLNAFKAYFLDNQNNFAGSRSRVRSTICLVCEKKQAKREAQNHENISEP